MRRRLEDYVFVLPDMNDNQMLEPLYLLYMKRLFGSDNLCIY